ncbi:DNA-processing protein DprA [bacterium]|nr:DNA-processing protein DprA [bacterium]
MTNNSEDKYFIAFSSIEEISSAFVKTILDIKGTIKAAWESEEKDFYNSGLRKASVEKFLEKRDKIDPDKLLNLTVEKGINWITYNSENYPELLRNIDSPPMVLFYRGNLKRVNFEKTLSVVGSRKASTMGKENLGRILKDFYGTDLTIVSGGAAGVDTCAHENAIKNNLSTVVVIGSGLDKLYPVQNEKMFEEICQNYGVVMSEYWHDFEPLPFRFPIRNRIVSGLSKGTLIVEAALKSGAMITANLCLEQGRELMCMPGNINNPNTQGIYHLLKNGASMITNGQDIMDVMNWEKIKSSAGLENSKNSNLPEKERKIIDEISIEPLSADIIASRLSFDIGELMMLLTTMELSGLIKQIEGAKYTTCN